MVGTAPGANSSSLPVLCAWPISGQYGPGSRALYYTLVATCVLARKARWLRDACIAAALLLPAVAALHGIVLAKMHVDGGYCPKQRAHETSTTLKSLSHLAAWMQSGPLGRPAARAGRQGAVDLDVYGAFQLSSIAILAAPVTLRRSTTYFDGPGRNIIFVWTAILLAGMLSLAVELFRSNPVPCAANNITAANFPYGEKASGLCGIQCSQELGPFSTMRQGATGEIYVIPAPKLFEFGTATLLAAGCCIISILSLVDIFNKIRHDNRKRHAREKDGATEDQDNSDGDDKDLSEGQPEATISGTNGATQSMMENAETRAKFLMGAVEIPLFAAAILAILVIGERNFMSPELSHGTEPMENVGQWAPIVTAGLAAIGSLYLLGENNLRKWRIKNKWKLRRRLSNATATTATTAPTFLTRRQSSATCAHCQGHLESPTDVRSDSAVGPPDRGGAEPTSGSRDRINEALSRFADILGTANPGQKSFREGPAADFPETPGERFKNSKFQEAKSKYDDISRDRLPSRAPSIRTAMCEDGEAPASPKTDDSSRIPTAERSSSSRLPRIARRDDSSIPMLKIQAPSPSHFPFPRVGTHPAKNQGGSSSRPATERGRPGARRHTLEVPSLAQPGSSSSTSSSPTETHRYQAQASSVPNSSPHTSPTNSAAETCSLPSKPPPTHGSQKEPK
ncbi:hypothetical protein RB601_004530 [Gaeumannomyces tritici]